MHVEIKRQSHIDRPIDTCFMNQNTLCTVQFEMHSGLPYSLGCLEDARSQRTRISPELAALFLVYLPHAV